MKKRKTKHKTRIEEFLDPWQVKRKQRIAFIMRLLNSQGEVELDQFLGSISTEYGIRRQTLKEYLKDLQDYGVVEVKDGKIEWVGKEESEKEG